jgi:hypothetical protein
MRSNTVHEAFGGETPLEGETPATNLRQIRFAPCLRNKTHFCPNVFVPREDQNQE